MKASEHRKRTRVHGLVSSLLSESENFEELFNYSSIGIAALVVRRFGRRFAGGVGRQGGELDRADFRPGTRAASKFSWCRRPMLPAIWRCPTCLALPFKGRNET